MITVFKKCFCIYFAIAYLSCFIKTHTIERKLLLGIECITKKVVQKHTQKSNPRVGLITNQTGISQKGLLSVQVLQKKSIAVHTIFAPEHGYWGTVPAGSPVQATIDPLTKVPVLSLYAHGAGKNVTEEQVKDIDLLIFDMQDCGMRHFTYISTLYKVMEGCKTFKIPLIVCDRPNPLGRIMEGPLVDPALQSFISIAPIPLRHGLTIGELALYFNNYLMGGKVLLKVIPMKHYKGKREDFVLLAPLSPNLKTLNAVYGYSFLGLIGEIKPFDVGVGTLFAFECIGLPKSIKNSFLFINQLEEQCKKMNLPIKRVFYDNQKKEPCIGLQLNFASAKKWSTMRLVFTILEETKQTGIALTFSSSFNKAFGNDCIQRYTKTNNAISKDWIDNIFNQSYTFCKKAKHCYLYKPYPSVLY